MSRPELTASLAASAYSVGWAAVRRMPEGLAYASFERLADLAHARRGPRVDQLSANLRRVVGPELPAADLDRLVKLGMRSYLRYWCEVFRLPTWSAATVRDRVLVHDIEILDDALAAGRGAVLALPHSANWDAAAAWVGASGRLDGRRVPFTTVAERVRPESLYDRFVAYRESLGLEVLPLTAGAAAVRTLVERLRAGGLIVLPADRDVSGGGIDVEFFGEPARMPGGPALLAHLTGAPLITVDLWYAPDGRIELQLHPPIELSRDGDRQARIARATQAVATSFERGIAAHPQDWHMLQPLWVADLGAEREVHDELRGEGAR